MPTEKDLIIEKQKEWDKLYNLDEQMRKISEIQDLSLGKPDSTLQIKEYIGALTDIEVLKRTNEILKEQVTELRILLEMKDKTIQQYQNKQVYIPYVQNGLQDTVVGAGGTTSEYNKIYYNPCFYDICKNSSGGCRGH